MLHWLKLLVQFLLVSKALERVSSPSIDPSVVTSRIRRVAIAIFALLISAMLFVISLTVAVVDLGLQIDRQEGFRIDGLLGSALALLALSISGAVFSYTYGFSKRRRKQDRASVDTLTQALIQARKARREGELR